MHAELNPLFLTKIVVIDGLVSRDFIKITIHLRYDLKKKKDLRDCVY